MDTIGLYLNWNQIGSDRKIPQNLTDVKETKFESGQVVISGRVQNLLVSVSENGISIKGGSLTKFYFGESMEQMNREDLEFAFQKMSDTLNMPFEKAQVIKYHLARDIITDHPGKMYLDYFGPCLRYIRLPMPTGLYYKLSSTKNELCVYDKIAEAKKKREPISEFYRTKNLLRFEDRVNTNPAKVLKLNNLIGADLYTDEVYMSISNDWYRKFSSIQYNLDIELDFSQIRTVSQLKKAGVVVLINQLGGFEKLLKMLDLAQQRNELDRKQKKDLKDLIKECASHKFHTIIPEMVTEIQSKIQLTSKYYR